MPPPPRQLTAPTLLALLKEGTLAGDWVLDPHRSSIRLKSRTVFGLLPVKGVFREVSGSGTVSRDGSASGTLTVAAASISTRNPLRDAHLRSAGFFDSGTYPNITFTSDSILPSDSGVAVTGALTVRGRRGPLSFDPVVSVPGDGEIWLDAEVRVDRADIGHRWKRIGMVSPTAMTIHAVFTRQ